MKKNSKYIVEERILIDADINIVWKHMTDWDSYHKWNPFIRNVDYQVNEENNIDKMKFYLQWHDGKKGTSIEQMVSLVPPSDGSAKLVYKYASLIAKLGLLKATRIQQLHTKGNQTEDYTKEEFFGVLARFVPIKAVKKGFSAQAKALATIAKFQYLDAFIHHELSMNIKS